MKNRERFFSLLSIIIGWLFVVPLSLFIPRKKGMMILVGRDARHYADNTKYFNNYLLVNGVGNVYYLFEKKTKVTSRVPNAIYYPSFRSIWLLLRCEYVIIDTSTWFRKLKYHLSVKAKKIQLWHGVGSKKIEMATDTFTQSKLKHVKILYGMLRGQLIKYKLISSTSDYYSRYLYSDAFRYKEILPLGQARNDIFFREKNELDFINTDDSSMNRLFSFKKVAGTKVVLYCPTYRKNKNTDLIDLEKLNTFCSENQFLFVIKYHILENVTVSQNYSNIVFYKRECDIYPLMSESDVMVTDYSSIYLDFLLTNKDIVFYIPDFEDYLQTQAGLRSDFMEISPGEKCENQEELHSVLKSTKTRILAYQQESDRLKELSYKYRDGNASERILNYLASNSMK